MDSKPFQCPYCCKPIVVMRALNFRRVVVNVDSIDDMLVRTLEGRMFYNPRAGHVPHAATCGAGIRFDADHLLEEARRARFREQAKKRSVKPADTQLDQAYRTLGVDIDAAPETVKSEYRKLCRQYHPDVNPAGLETIQMITQAYGFLKRSGRI
jgi:hypothetical protein